MRNRRLLVGMLVVVLLLLLAAAPAAAQGNEPGKVILGGQYTLRSGERLLGDLAVLGGDAELEAESQVAGDVLVAGGTVRVRGAVDGDVLVLGGQLELADTAFIDGDLVSVGGTVRQAEGAVVSGERIEGFEFDFPGFGIGPLVPRETLTPDWQRGTPIGSSPGAWLLNFIMDLVRAAVLTLALAALALVVALFWPQGVKQVGETLLQQPVLSLAVGLLSWVLVFGLSVVMIVTICLLPFAIALLLALLAALLLAWIAAGWVVGHKLLAALKVRIATTVWETAVGTLIIVAGYFLVGILPCADFVYGTLVASLGLGAVVLTRFGTQPYQPESGATEPVVPDSPLKELLPPLPVTTRSAEELGIPPAVAERTAEAMAAAPEFGGEIGTAQPSPGDAPSRLEVIELPAEGVLVQPAPELVADSDEAEVVETVVLGEADDLDLIVGIGPVFSRRLQAAGIRSFVELAATEVEILARIVDVSPDRIRREDWIGQASERLV